MTQFLLACYDHGDRSARDGSFWVWVHPDLRPELLTRFFYDFVAKVAPAVPSSLTGGSIQGGWAGIDSQWGCVYRFFNGGRDYLDRPGRYIVVCAFYRSQVTDRFNGLNLLSSSELFGRWASSAEVPLPAPQGDLSLDLDVALPPESECLDDKGQIKQKGAECTDLVAAGKPFHCTVVCDTAGTRVERREPPIAATPAREPPGAVSGLREAYRLNPSAEADRSPVPLTKSADLPARRLSGVGVYSVPKKLAVAIIVLVVVVVAVVAIVHIFSINTRPSPRLAVSTSSPLQISTKPNAPPPPKVIVGTTLKQENGAAHIPMPVSGKMLPANSQIRVQQEFPPIRNVQGRNIRYIRQHPFVLAFGFVPGLIFGLLFGRLIWKRRGPA